MAIRLNWSEQSLNDLIGIAEYIARDSDRYAKLTVRRIREKTQILKTNPFAGRIVPEINNPEIRELIMGNFRIIYLIVSKSQIDILTIYHSARVL